MTSGKSSTPAAELNFDNPVIVNLYTVGEALTGIFAELLLRQAGLDAVGDETELVFVDHGCGTSIVAAKLQNLLSDKAKARLDMTCSDNAEAMVDWSRRRIESEDWKGVKAIKSDALDTKMPSNHFTHYTFNFGPFMFPQWQAVLDEAFRILQPGSTVAVGTWQEIGWIPDVIDSFAADPELQHLASVGRFDTPFIRSFSGGAAHCEDPEWVKEALCNTGFVEVEVTSAQRRSTIEDVEAVVRLSQLMLGVSMPIVWGKDVAAKHLDRARHTLAEWVKKKYAGTGVVWDSVAILATAKKPTE